MSGEANNFPRLQFLARVVRKECQHLATTDQRLFGSLFTQATPCAMHGNVEI